MIESNFDLDAWRKAKFFDRVEAVTLDGLTGAGFGGYEDDSDEARPKLVVYHIKQLTALELAEAEQMADNSKLLIEVAEKLAGKHSDRLSGLMTALGAGGNTPEALAKKLAHVHLSLVEPKLPFQDVVLLADRFPMDFLQLARVAYDLTGKGKIAQVKRKPSGKTQVSKPA